MGVFICQMLIAWFVLWIVRNHPLIQILWEGVKELYAAYVARYI